VRNCKQCSSRKQIKQNCKRILIKKDDFMESRIRVFTGHFGSGKTVIAINYALRLKNDGRNVCIADLDIVNPYFCAMRLSIKSL